MFLHIPVQLILRQPAAWSLIPTPFQGKVSSTLQPVGGTGWSPFIILYDPPLLYTKDCRSINKQFSIDSFLNWEGHN